ncbi:MAG TPA: transcription antitermination factor NusB [Candidatus Eremiobacteraceae bacterium]|nr:transcription antitermination factor NusB [Candidatus Eremiobacteraceae bacterium]
MTARDAALRALLRGGDSAGGLDAELRVAKLAPRDAAFATELSYGTLKMRRALTWSVQTALRRPFETLDPPLRWVLLLGAYQLLYLDRVPPHGAVDESVKLARAHGHAGTAGLANAALRKIAVDRPKPRRPKSNDDPSVLGIYASLPDWIAAHFIERFGFEAALQAAEGLNVAPRRALRLGAGQEPPTGSQPGRYGVPETAIVDSLADSARAYVVQSEESQLAVHLLDPQPGETIIDICAGRGVKTGMIAGRLQGRGQIVSVDDDKSKLANVRRDVTGGTAVTVLRADARLPLPDAVPEGADRALVDAPCSGLGILGRRADARWRKSPDDPARFSPVQRAILAGAAAKVKSGGTLLYATCSTHIKEDEESVGAFLETHRDWRAIPIDLTRSISVATAAGMRMRGPYLQIVPGIEGADGFFYARLERRQA